MAEQKKSSNGKEFLIGALVGGIIGFSAALLLAPQTGRQLREELAETYQHVSKKAKQLVRQAGDYTGTVSEKVKELTEGKNFYNFMR